MKSFKIFALVLLLSGCATTQPIVTNNFIPPSADVMKRCSRIFAKSKTGSFDEIKDMLILEREERKACIRLDKDKADYIERQLIKK